MEIVVVRRPPPFVYVGATEVDAVVDGALIDKCGRPPDEDSDMR
jgi:hypothetical protein